MNDDPGVSRKSENPLTITKRSRLALLVLCGYITLSLVPNSWPGVGASSPYFFYLVGLAVWAGLGLLSARVRRIAPNPRHYSRIRLAGLSLLWFVCVFGIGRWLKGDLPTGSGLLAFDPVVWQQPESSKFVKGDITLRQKMLGDVVNNSLPVRGRMEIEKLLGPSLHSAYFENTGRALIYLLGTQRDSFFAIDSEWPLIWLDGSGRFARYEVYKDQRGC